MASDWRPDGWLADMDSMTTQQAEEAVTAAREALAALHQVQAITEAEAQQAADAKATVPALRDRLRVANEGAQAIASEQAVLPLANVKRAVENDQRELNQLRQQALSSKALKCPHCEGFVALDPEGGLYPFDGEAERLEKESAAAKATEVERHLAERSRRVEELEAVALTGQARLQKMDREVVEAKTDLGVAEKLAGNADAEVETEGRRADPDAGGTGRGRCQAHLRDGVSRGAGCRAVRDYRPIRRDRGCPGAAGRPRPDDGGRPDAAQRGPLSHRPCVGLADSRGDGARRGDVGHAANPAMLRVRAVAAQAAIQLTSRL